MKDTKKIKKIKRPSSKKGKTIGKGVPIGEKPLQTAFRLQGKTYFLTYRGRTPTGHFIKKNQLADFLLNQCQTQAKVRPEKYLVSEQMYDSGEPHFHVILTYPKRKQILDPRTFDYQGIHPNVQTMRNMKAALDYMYKQDPHPYTNMDIANQRLVSRAKDTSSLYQLLRQQMLKDVFRFDVHRWCAEHHVDKHMYHANYAKAINLITKMQPAFARLQLRRKPGIKLITPALIRQRLTTDEVELFYSDPCFQKIVDHINQIHRFPNTDPSTTLPYKTPHLLLVGDSSIGKSALVEHRPTPEHPYPGLSHYYATYNLSIGQKYFPPYRAFDYRLVRWNQFTVVSDMFPKSAYHRLLDYLEGAPSALPQKGRAPVQRQDNPKHILTSNRSLKTHIRKTFSSTEARRLVERNLGTRIDCVQIPYGKSIHFLRKLFVPNDQRCAANLSDLSDHDRKELNDLLQIKL